MNTDRELWRERDGDYYAPSVHVTKGGCIGINVGGYVIVKPLREWHALAQAADFDPVVMRSALASAIEAATAGETTKIGSTEGESAVREAQTPKGPRP